MEGRDTQAGRIRMSRTDSNFTDAYITMMLTGDGGRIVEVTMTLQDFAAAVTGMQSPCEYRQFPSSDKASSPSTEETQG